MTTVAVHATIYLKDKAGQSKEWKFENIDRVTHPKDHRMFLVEKNSQILAMIPADEVVMVVLDYDNVPDIGDEPNPLPIHEEDEDEKEN